MTAQQQGALVQMASAGVSAAEHMAVQMRRLLDDLAPLAPQEHHERYHALVRECDEAAAQFRQMRAQVESCRARLIPPSGLPS